MHSEQRYAETSQDKCNKAKRQAPLVAGLLLWCLPMMRAPNPAALPNKEPALRRCTGGEANHAGMDMDRLGMAELPRAHSVFGNQQMTLLAQRGERSGREPPSSSVFAVAPPLALMQLLLLATISRWRAPRGFARWRASWGTRLTALLCLFVPEALAQQCASAPTCPAYSWQSGLALDTCSMKQYGQTWGLRTMYAGTKLSGKQLSDGGFPIAMPGKGLYTILKVSKDESNCCYDLEVQGFMCEVMRNKTAVRALVPCCCCCARLELSQHRTEPPLPDARACRWTTWP
jgi:hypothetical protein